jgi:hypothetical protein
VSSEQSGAIGSVRRLPPRSNAIREARTRRGPPPREQRERGPPAARRAAFATRAEGERPSARSAPPAAKRRPFPRASAAPRAKRGLDARKRGPPRKARP